MMAKTAMSRMRVETAVLHGDDDDDLDDCGVEDGDDGDFSGHDDYCDYGRCGDDDVDVDVEVVHGDRAGDVDGDGVRIRGVRFDLS